MGAVVIGMDPHKRSATIEVMGGDEAILGGGRYATDVAGCNAMVKFGRQFGERTWAIEGCNGIGKHVATRLLADGEPVVDVPPKLSARVRVFATGQGRKTDATDAHSVALVGTRMMNRQINRVLHIMAVVQLRRPTEGRRRRWAKAAAGWVHRRTAIVWPRCGSSDQPAFVSAGPGATASDPTAAFSRGRFLSCGCRVRGRNRRCLWACAVDFAQVPSP